MSVTQTTSDGIRVITMDDGKANAVSHALLDELEPVLAAAEQDDAVRGVVLTGREGRFSAGFDLSIMQGADFAKVQELVVRGGRLVPQIYAFPKPFIAAASGHAIAMGAVILLASDHRIGAKGDFKVGLNENAIGMTLPVFGSELARTRIPPARLTEAILGAVLYPPEEAVAVGYLDEITTPDRVVELAVERASALAAHPMPSYAGNKMRLRGEVIETIKASLG